MYITTTKAKAQLIKNLQSKEPKAQSSELIALQYCNYLKFFAKVWQDKKKDRHQHNQ